MLGKYTLKVRGEAMDFMGTKDSADEDLRMQTTATLPELTAILFYKEIAMII